MPRRLSRVVGSDMKTGETPLAGLMVVTWPIFTWSFVLVAVATIALCLALGTTARTLLVAVSVEIIIGAVVAGVWVREHTEVGSLFAGLVVTNRRLLAYPTTTQLGIIQPLRLDVDIDDVESVRISPSRFILPRQIEITMQGHPTLSVTSRLLGSPDEFVAAFRAAVDGTA
jgi:hypothetical protein